MAKPTIEPGDVLDGFVMEQLIHRGGMARLWSVTKPGIDMPLLMKVPVLGEGQDPAAIVSFEMEQMIMPRLSGPHAPHFVAAGDFAVHPYIVMERLPGKSLLPRLADLPLSYDEVVQIGWQIATALDDIHRQHVIHLDIKPSNILFRPTGEAVLVDYGLSHHLQLPDLMQEEFRLPYGTAPYMAPEQLMGARNDARTDQFALGVLLYFFSTGIRPFGESESLGAMKKRLWRDPKPPRLIRKDYPIWLQEIVLRCLEVEPAWRYPSMAQLAFDLSHHDQIKLTARSERMTSDSFWARMKRRFNSDLKEEYKPRETALPSFSAPIVAVAVDTTESVKETNEAVREAAARALKHLPSARLACLNVLKQSYIATRDTTLDAEGHNKHVNRLVALKDWAAPLKLKEGRITYHVLESTDAAAAILTYAEQNKVDQIIIGARQQSLRRSLLGSVSGKVASEANCTVTVVRPPRSSRPAEAEAVEEAAAPEKVEAS
jgi:eukaryotic-like serine/threonine-protein kinase